ncbi:MAG: hypothetical protein KC503_09690, partial [Myxococcales bacterium]|nr:hypothetical protein [Myxococcales bacterium]
AERKQRWRWLGVLALAAATAAVLALVLWPRPDGTSDPGATPINPPRVQYRGGSGSAAADPRLHLVALELFAISPAGNSASSTANRDGAFGAPRLLADGDAVTLGDYLQLRYRNDDPALRYIYVFGLDGRKAPLSYYPRPSQRTPRRAATGVHSLGRSLRLSHRHRRGPLHVVAVLSQQPLDHDAVAKALQAALAGAHDVDVGHRLGRLKVGANVRVVHRQLIVR